MTKIRKYSAQHWKKSGINLTPIDSNVNVGIGVTPTARLHLAAGTATANTAPVKLTSGTLLTVPEIGVIEYYDGRYYITSVTRRVISRASDSIIIPATVADTVTETTVWTGTLAIDSIRPYKVYRVNFYGKFSTANASATVTIRIKLNSTVVVILTSTGGTVTDDFWHGSATLTARTIGVTGTVSGHGDVMLGVKSVHTNTSSIIVDTTAATNIIVTIQWSAALAGNTLTLDQAFLEVMN